MIYQERVSLIKAENDFMRHLRLKAFQKLTPQTPRTAAGTCSKNVFQIPYEYNRLLKVTKLSFHNTNARQDVKSPSAAKVDWYLLSLA